MLIFKIEEFIKGDF